MRLAPDNIVIEHGGKTVRLRPSLRAAFRLNEKHGFGQLVQAIEETNVSIIADIIEETSDALTARRLLMAKVDANGVRAIQHLSRPLFDLLIACYGADLETPPAEARLQRGKPFSTAAALSELYTVATGWLGWTAEEALAAIPSQIVAAHEGHIAKLRALNGTSEQPDETYDPRDLPTDEQVREGIEKLRAFTGKPSL